MSGNDCVQNCSSKNLQPASQAEVAFGLAFGWLLARPYVASVIAGATAPEQVRQNADSLGWQLTADEIAAVDRITAR